MENNGADRHYPFDPYIWRESRRKKQQELENKRRALLKEIDRVLTELNERYEWEAVFIFGTVTRPGKLRSNSDVDIGIKGLNKFDLYSFIGDISLLLNRDVDVVTLEECGFAEKIVERGIRWHPKKNW